MTLDAAVAPPVAPITGVETRVISRADQRIPGFCGLISRKQGSGSR